MNCPRCATLLNTVECTEPSAPVEVDVCMECEGIWFDEGELDKLEQIVEPQFVEIRQLPSKELQEMALVCPSCPTTEIMEKKRHDRDEQVIYDECSNCKGIWLDGGELRAIQQEHWGKTIVRLGRWLIGK